MTQQPNLFGDTVYDALEQLVAALGGNKVVGYHLWPEEGPERAGQHLRDALNPKHRSNLAPDKLMVLLTLAHEKGIHCGMEFINSTVGYEPPKPINRVNETIETQKLFNRKVDELAALIAVLRANGVELKAVK